MEVVGRHKKLNRSEEKVLDWLEEGLQKVEGKILVEPGYRKFKYQDWPDFVLVTKTHGILIIECKGFYSEEIDEVSNVDLLLKTGTDRYGKQLASYGCIFNRLLQGKNVQVSKYVIFPQILSSHPAANAIMEFNTEPEDVRVLFNEHLDWPCSLEFLGASPLRKKILADEYNEILGLVNPTRVISYDPTLDLEGIQKSLKILDEKQTEHVEKMAKGHHLLNGLPGTGKTIMLMQIAEREISLGKKILYTCFNVPLKEYVESIFGKEVTRTSQSLLYHLAIEYGADEMMLKEDFKNPIAYLSKHEIKPKYDSIMVDEYQDLDDREIEVLAKLLNPGGLLVLGGDRLQSIRSHRESWKSLGVHIKGHSYFLERPYRTDPDLVDYALAFISTSKTLEKEALNYFDDYEFEHQWGTFKNLESKINFWSKDKNVFEKEVIKVKEKNPRAHILIITPTADHNKMISGLRSNKIRVETFQRVKGLEADIVIFFGIDDYLRTEETAFPMTNLQKMRSVFSGLCRSRGSVYIHGFEYKDFYLDLREIFNNCVKKKIA